jgi:hypothetical protein
MPQQRLTYLLFYVEPARNAIAGLGGDGKAVNDYVVVDISLTAQMQNTECKMQIQNGAAYFCIMHYPTEPSISI